MTRFFLFPGQGSQRPGMGADFYGRSAPARAVLDETAALLGDGFLDALFHGDAAGIDDTRLAQPALLAVGVAIARHLETQGIRPNGCAGHSVGEIPALVIAGALAYPDAVAITRERARLTSERVPDGGMAAVIGLDAAAIEAALPGGVEVANFNGPGQTIVSGTRAGLEAAQRALKDAGARRVMPLKVSGPFHSTLMAKAADGMRAVLADVPLRAPTVRFVSSVTAQDESDPGRIRELLWRQLTAPVRWTALMARLGPVPALEIGPGKVLEGLARRMDGAPDVAPAGTLEAVEALDGVHTH